MPPSFSPFFSTFVVGVFAAALLAGCEKQSSSHTANASVDYYTCTMHPSVHSHDPNAKCPICSMDLEPVLLQGTVRAQGVQTAGGARLPEFHEFSVPVERQQQIGVTYAQAKVAPLNRTIRAVGTVAADMTRHWEFVARVEGYVEKLEVTSPGEAVRKDQALMSIYSPDMAVTERELVNQLNVRDLETTVEGKRRNLSLIESTRRRLEQWNITPQQIAELEKSREAPEFLTLRSPFDGVVEEVPVNQGRRVIPGDRLVDVVDLSHLWVWAEFYENELALLVKGQNVIVTSSTYPGDNFNGEIALVSPFLSDSKRTARVRLDIPNPDFKLRPGMFVTVELAVECGQALTIPLSAVMPTGERTLVFVDKGEGKLEPRAIQLGGQYGDLYEIRSGLQGGERVVASANFLIDAESKVQGAVKSFAEPTTGDSKQAATAGKTKETPLSKEVRTLYQPAIADYLAVKKLLAQDKLDGLVAQVAQLPDRVRAISTSGVKPSEQADDYQKHVDAVAVALEQFKAGTIDEARISFGETSAALIALLNEFPPPLENTVFVLNCPMWEKSPNDWIQTTEAIENPFMGTRMSGCGDVVRKIVTDR